MCVGMLIAYEGLSVVFIWGCLGVPQMGDGFELLSFLGFEFLLSFLDNLKYPIKWKRKIKKPCIKWDLFMSCVRIDWLLGVRFERTISHPFSIKDIHSQMGTQFTRFLGLVKFSDEQYTYPLFTNYWMLRVLRIPLWVASQITSGVVLGNGTVTECGWVYVQQEWKIASIWLPSLHLRLDFQIAPRMLPLWA